jgi:hypothetical protein
LKLHFVFYDWRDKINPSIELHIGNWWLSFYFNPRVWAFVWPKNSCNCCKFWGMCGPFEVSSAYTEGELDKLYHDEE